MAAVAAATTMVMAGGDIVPVEVMEVEVVPSKTGIYVGGAYGMVNAEYSETGYGYTISEDNDYDSIMVQAGWDYNQYIGVVGKYWFGLTNTVDYAEQGYVYSVDKSVDTLGIYVQPQYSFDAVKVYGLLGYAWSTGTTEGHIGNLNVTADEDFDGFSYGLGAAYAFTDSISVFAEYVNQYDDVTNYFDGYENIEIEKKLDVVNIGVNYNF